MSENTFKNNVDFAKKKLLEIPNLTAEKLCGMWFFDTVEQAEDVLVAARLELATEAGSKAQSGTPPLPSFAA